MAILKCGVTITLAKRVASLLDDLSSKIQVPGVLLTVDHLAQNVLPLCLHVVERTCIFKTVYIVSLLLYKKLTLKFSSLK